MKKICFVEYDMSVFGGVEQVTATLANSLCETYEVSIFGIFGKGKEVAYELDDRIMYHAELEEDCRIRERIQKIFTPFRLFIKRHHIDVVFLMENHPALIVSPVRFLTKAKFVYCDHGALINEWEKKDITAFRFWDALISHRVVTLTKQNQEDYTKKLHISKKKMRTIYNWIDPKIIKEKVLYEIESKRLLTVGRLSEEKGHMMLLQVAKEVMPKHPDWQWHIYGDGDERKKIEKKIIEYGLEKQVLLMGNVKEVYKKYKEYAMIVLTSYREGLPLVLLEAKALGLPMVSFDVVTGPREIIDDGRNGYLIPSYEIETMAQKIDLLMSDRTKRIEFSNETWYHLERFRKEVIYPQWRSLIEEL
ncbi:MAG: glycosyltransferase family 4 protein, partial [Lachnospiraceae bacterium]